MSAWLSIYGPHIANRATPLYVNFIILAPESTNHTLVLKLKLRDLQKNEIALEFSF